MGNIKWFGTKETLKNSRKKEQIKFYKCILLSVQNVSSPHIFKAIKSL
jgi:hypothetical protein